ncbi:hypothetical protein IAT38_006843 [Cryptococcus sp. DSM 104549]
MAKPSQDCIVLFGDSLTEWQKVPGSLQQKMSEAYVRKLDIINRGFSGYNSLWARCLLDDIFAKKGEPAPVVRLVTILLGTNDAVLPHLKETNPLSQYRDDLTYMLESLTSPTSPYATADTPGGLNIALITPPPICIPQFSAERFNTRTLERAKEYADAVRELGDVWKEKAKGEKWKLEVLDLWEGIEKAAGGLGDGLADFFVDGVHLSTEGYAIFWKLYEDLVRGEWKGRGLDWADPEDLPSRTLSWEQIDDARPESVGEKLALPRCRQ